MTDMATSREESEIKKAAAKNIGKALLEEMPTGIRIDMNLWIEARDRKNAWVLIGGYGSFGVGQMWSRDDGSDQNLPGYADAPERCAKEGFGQWGPLDWRAEETSCEST